VIHTGCDENFGTLLEINGSWLLMETVHYGCGAYVLHLGPPDTAAEWRIEVICRNDLGNAWQVTVLRYGGGPYFMSYWYDPYQHTGNYPWGTYVLQEGHNCDGGDTEYSYASFTIAEASI
jgi:hypothetical protein